MTDESTQTAALASVGVPRLVRPPVESDEPVRLGRYYSVPCVFVSPWKRTVPILGPLHEDKNIIGFPDEHWHIDWRFVDSRWFRTCSARHPVHAKVVSAKKTAGGIVRRNLKCKRLMPEFPFVRHSWMASLEDAFSSARLRAGLVCPHRGISLAGCPVNNGVVVCPGHGLAWCVATGELSRRSNSVLNQ